MGRQNGLGSTACRHRQAVKAKPAALQTILLLQERQHRVSATRTSSSTSMQSVLTPQLDLVS